MRSVTCRACGARIRSDRLRCLRCDAPLQSDVERRKTEAPDPIPAWLSSRPAVIAGAAASVAAFTALLIVWAPSAVPDEEARPAAPIAAPASTSRAAASRTTAASPPAAVSAPVGSGAVIDTTRAASAAFTTGDLASARTKYEEALARTPHDPEALNNLGLVLERQGEIDAAVEKFSQAVTLASSRWAYHFNLAHAEGRLEHWDRAIAGYRTAAGLFPEDYATQYNLALALRKKGDEPAAITAFEKAIVLAPGEPTFHLALGTSLEAVGKPIDAVREYQRYLDMAPSAPDVNQVTARIASLRAPVAPSQPPAPGPQNALPPR